MQCSGWMLAVVNLEIFEQYSGCGLSLDTGLKTDDRPPLLLRHLIYAKVSANDACFYLSFHLVSMRDSTAGIASGYGLGGQGIGVQFPPGTWDIALRHSVLRLNRPPVQCLPGVLSRPVKWQGCEGDRSPSSSAELTNMWIYNSPGVVLNYAQGQFYLCLVSVFRLTSLYSI
jgi:hypothetical protein